MISPTGRQAEPVRTRLKLPTGPATYLWAVTAVALGVALRTLLAHVLGVEFPFITFFPAIFAVAYIGGFGPTLFATLLSVLAVVYLFVDPVPTLPLGDPAAQVGAALFILSGIATGWLGESRLRANRRAEAALVGQDATDRVRAQDATARLAAIVDSSEDAIIGKQLDGPVVDSAAINERTGLPIRWAGTSSRIRNRSPPARLSLISSMPSPSGVPSGARHGPP